MAQNEFGYSSNRVDDINKCDVCNDIRTFLVRGDLKTSSELRPAEFYLQNLSEKF